jgi:hypothetical protein
VRKLKHGNTPGKALKFISIRSYSKKVLPERKILNDRGRSPVYIENFYHDLIINRRGIMVDF